MLKGAHMKRNGGENAIDAEINQSLLHPFDRLFVVVGVNDQLAEQRIIDRGMW